MKKAILVVGLFSLASSAHSIAGEIFWSRGMASMDDYVGARQDATDKANQRCAPHAAKKMSEWEDGYAGRFVYSYAQAIFECQG